jgi:alpha-ketoglutarate-dependent 2,4-dichlorophenoxyacetate dioxygenase
MDIRLDRLHSTFVVEVKSFDIATPMDDATRDTIITAMDEHAICVFRSRVPVADEVHLAFGRAFGPLMRQKMQQTVSGRGIRLTTDELVDVGNLDENGNIHAADDPRRAFHKGNQLWHSDVTFDPVRASYSLLAAHIVPPVGADTEFADMRAAYDDLPMKTRAEIDSLVAEHSIWYSRVLGGMEEPSEEVKATRPPTRHPLVQVNPRTGRKSLYLASHASHIVGRPQRQGRALLDELIAHATQAKYVYRHQWRVGDIVMWDNLQTMHRGVPFDDTRYPRDMRRATVLEREPVAAI